MPRIISKVKEWQAIRRSEKLSGKRIGFVPTMGNLHAGHESLIRRCAQENDVSVLSIFVNATQFNNASDLEKYPRTLNEDIVLAEKYNVDYILAPEHGELYPDEYTYKVSESNLSKELEGEHRPGHFDGALTVVMKLLCLIRPTNAYFGEKDYQQLELVRGMVETFFLETKIIPCPIVRDEGDLALSSRNSLLSLEEIILARKFPEELQSGKSCEEVKQRLEGMGIKVEYVEDVRERRLGAVQISGVRLIDNINLKG